MNVTNTKLDDVRKAFDALPLNGLNVEFDGRIKANEDPNSHIQGLAPYRTFQLIAHSDFGEPAGRLLVASRLPGKERLVTELRLPVLSATKPFFFHPGGCQVIGDCLALPIETGDRRSVVTFFDVSDPQNIREVNPAARIDRPHSDAGCVGVTNFTVSGKTFWLLGAYDNGATDFYLSQDDTFPGQFTIAFSAKLEETEHQGFCLLTDVTDQVFAVGFHRTTLGRDMATLYTVDVAAKQISVVSERHFKTKGPSDLIGSGPHFRWGVGLEIVSATELAVCCTERRYDADCNINSFDSAKLSMRSVVTAKAARARRPAKPRAATARATKKVRRQVKKSVARAK
jgi:hypothetical protein